MLSRQIRTGGAGYRRAERLPGAGIFELFREQETARIGSGSPRRLDGSPTGPWGWEDLD